MGNVVKTLIFVVLMGGTVMVLIPIKLFFSSYRLNVEIGILRYFGLIPVLFGITICLWSWGEFIFKGKGTPAPYDPPKELVTSGLYRFTRNPMYIGVIFVLFGEALLSESALLLFYAGLIFLIFHIWTIITEEPYLRSTFGVSYKRYCESVPRWLIRLK
jgi:protein-S-isoprenylcysteine O-methyltransferase Ste14